MKRKKPPLAEVCTSKKLLSIKSFCGITRCVYGIEVTDLDERGHELIHAEHYMDGDYSPRSETASHTYKNATGKTVTQTTRKEELRTVGLAGTKKDDITENQLRKEQKQNKRGAY